MTQGQLPEIIHRLADECSTAGGKALLVGGTARDRWLGKKPEDWDVEIHGIEEESLHRILRTLKAKKVGKSYGVWKLRDREWELDISLPSKEGRLV